MITNQESITVKIMEELKNQCLDSSENKKKFYVYDKRFRVYSISQGFIEIENAPEDIRFSLSEVGDLISLWNAHSTEPIDYTSDLLQLKQNAFAEKPLDTPEAITKEMERILSLKNHNKHSGNVRYNIFNDKGLIFSRTLGFHIPDSKVINGHLFSENEVNVMMEILSDQGHSGLIYKFDNEGTDFDSDEWSVKDIILAFIIFVFYLILSFILATIILPISVNLMLDL